MRVRLGEAAMVPDDFRSTDTVRFPASLDGLRKHFLDITRVLDAADVDFWRHSICGAEMDAANTAQPLIEVLLECDVPDAVQLNLILAQVKAATLDDEFCLGQGVLRKGQRQRKDGVAFSVGPENLFFVQYHKPEEGIYSKACLCENGEVPDQSCESSCGCTRILC